MFDPPPVSVVSSPPVPCVPRASWTVVFGGVELDDADDGGAVGVRGRDVSTDRQVIDWTATKLAPVSELPRSSRRVRDALVALELPADILHLEDATRTAPEAAAAVGCELGAIVKSLVMRGVDSGDPVLALVSGANRADLDRLAVALGETIERPDAAYVREVTGYAIGGIPPVGHPAPVRTFMDEDLLAFETVWAAAGHPHTIFPIVPAALATASRARVIRLS